MNGCVDLSVTRGRRHNQSLRILLQLIRMQSVRPRPRGRVPATAAPGETVSHLTSLQPARRLGTT